MPLDTWQSGYTVVAALALVLATSSPVGFSAAGEQRPLSLTAAGRSFIAWMRAPHAQTPSMLFPLTFFFGCRVSLLRNGNTSYR